MKKPKYESNKYQNSATFETTFCLISSFKKIPICIQYHLAFFEKLLLFFVGTITSWKGNKYQLLTYLVCWGKSCIVKFEMGNFRQTP